MEVHHHPHVEKKNFKEYLLEGLMIFVAVSMGFIAENFREHLVNKEKEREYISSFYEDVSYDIQRVPVLEKWVKEQVSECDSLLFLLNKKPNANEINKIYMTARDIVRGLKIDLYVHDRTITQIKNAADFRLISNKTVADKITAYYKLIEQTSYLQSIAANHKLLASQSMPLVLNAIDYSKVINNNDEIINPGENLILGPSSNENLNKLLFNISEIKGISISIERLVNEVEQSSISLKEVIRKQYSLENK